jgi:hypothetical protein
MTGNYVTVLRGESAALFLPDEGFEVNLEDKATRIRLRTQWRDAGLAHPVPADLWIDVTGRGDDLDETIQRHSSLARGMAAFFAYVANAAVEPLEIELAYDATDGLAVREYVQVFVRGADAIPRGGRLVPTKRLRPCVDALLSLQPTPRLERALFHYDLALRSWQLGGEYQTLEHLWIAAENIVELLLDRRTAGGNRKDLARSVGIEVDPSTPGQRKPPWKQDLSAWALRELVFVKDKAAYDSARTASNGYEHGFLDLSEVQQQAVRTTEDVFKHIRRSIADALLLADEPRSWLLALAPVDVASTRKTVRGTLRGAVTDAARLAAPGQEYPILTWRTRLSGFERDGDEFNASFTERMTVTVAEGVGFQGEALEVRGRQRPGVAAGTQTVVATTGLGPGDIRLDDIGDYLRRASSAIERNLDAVRMTGAEAVVLFGLLSHVVAMLESVTLLVQDRRALEALAIASRMFELATLLKWLANNPDERTTWLREWRESSLRDLIVLAEQDAETGRRPATRGDVARLVERSDPNVEPAQWPPDEDWLRTQSFEQGRQRLWWLWRLDRHLHWHEKLIDARSTSEPSIGFTTREKDVSDLGEVAAFAVEAASTARTAVGSTLGLPASGSLEDVLADTTQLLAQLPPP